MAVEKFVVFVFSLWHECYKFWVYVHGEYIHEVCGVEPDDVFAFHLWDFEFSAFPRESSVDRDRFEVVAVFEPFDKIFSDFDVAVEVSDGRFDDPAGPGLASCRNFECLCLEVCEVFVKFFAVLWDCQVVCFSLHGRKITCLWGGCQLKKDLFCFSC